LFSGGDTVRDDIGQVVLSEEIIQKRLRDMAAEMEAEMDEGVVMIGVLRGASVFVADLMRYMYSHVRLDYLQVGRSRNHAGDCDLQLIKDISTDISGETVLLLEDTIDTGDTLLFLKQHLLAKGADQVRICVLIDKSPQENDTQADYVGFHIDDLDGQWNYVVGYGIDFNEKYRNLPFVGVLKEELWAPLQI
jgi:hypoxanthine phosphoribosyltransferase